VTGEIVANDVEFGFGHDWNGPKARRISAARNLLVDP